MYGTHVKLMDTRIYPRDTIDWPFFVTFDSIHETLTQIHKIVTFYIAPFLVVSSCSRSL